MPTFRKERMGEAIRKVVTEKLIRDGSVFTNAFITVNKVDVSKDFRNATIFFSAFGDGVDESEVSAQMNQHRNEFRYEISQKLNLRRTPRVEFLFDKNTAYASKIDKMLSQK